MPDPAKAAIPAERIERKIYLIRGEKVMLDGDLAELYGVDTKAMNQAVKRNAERFPSDFMFQLTKPEADSLRSQIVTLKRGKHRKYAPYCFTENGVAMLSSVLNSKRAIAVNIQIMRTFTRIRKLLASHQEVLKSLESMQTRLDGHDAQFVEPHGQARGTNSCHAFAAWQAATSSKQAFNSSPGKPGACGGGQSLRGYSGHPGSAGHPEAQNRENRVRTACGKINHIKIKALATWRHCAKPRCGLWIPARPLQ